MSKSSLQLTDPVRAYLLDKGVREPAVLQKLREDTAALPAAQMQICPEQGALMHMLVQLTGARRVLEVGTFTGYSALAMALALPPDGHMTCCDLSEEWTAMARRAWQAAGVADRIDLRLAPALDTLSSLLEEGREGWYDLCFVDADKTNYPAYLERGLALVRSGGLLMFDNVLWGGSIVDLSDERDSTMAIRELNEALAVDERVDIVMLPIGDGLTLARKR